MKYLLICVSYGSGFQEVFNVADETQRVKEKAVISSVLIISLPLNVRTDQERYFSGSLAVRSFAYPLGVLLFSSIRITLWVSVLIFLYRWSTPRGVINSRSGSWTILAAIDS